MTSMSLGREGRLPVNTDLFRRRVRPPPLVRPPCHPSVASSLSTSKLCFVETALRFRSRSSKRLCLKR